MMKIQENRWEWPIKNLLFRVIIGRKERIISARFNTKKKMHWEENWPWVPKNHSWWLDLSNRLFIFIKSKQLTKKYGISIKLERKWEWLLGKVRGLVWCCPWIQRASLKLTLSGAALLTQKLKSPAANSLYLKTDENSEKLTL